jgi:hypothetical protein
MKCRVKSQLIGLRKGGREVTRRLHRAPPDAAHTTAATAADKTLDRSMAVCAVPAHSVSRQPGTPWERGASTSPSGAPTTIG